MKWGWLCGVVVVVFGSGKKGAWRWLHLHGVSSSFLWGSVAFLEKKF